MRKYVGYAAGEIALIITGILIALQIDSWNDKKQIDEELATQLDAVATSIAQDQDNLLRLKRERSDAIFDFNSMWSAAGSDRDVTVWYTPQYVEFASKLVARSQAPLYFVPGTGAFKALESSGNTSHMRDAQLRRNLLDYYATIDRIAFTEREMNALVRDVTLRYQTDTIRGLFPPYLRAPLIAWQAEEVEEYPDATRAFREAYRELLADSVTRALLRSGLNQSLMKEYEHLLTLGSVVLDQIEAHQHGTPADSSEADIFHPGDTLGPPRVFVEGRFEAHSLGIFAAPVPNPLDLRIDSMSLGEDSLKITYPGGAAWTFVYVSAGPLDVSVRKSFLDYSRYSRIRLELRKESGCEGLTLVLKDATDADDGSQANVPLTLSDAWDTYEYELSLFSDADLSRLNVVTGFLLDDQPCTFLVRNVSFL